MWPPSMELSGACCVTTFDKLSSENLRQIRCAISGGGIDIDDGNTSAILYHHLMWYVDESRTRIW